MTARGWFNLKTLTRCDAEALYFPACRETGLVNVWESDAQDGDGLSSLAFPLSHIMQQKPSVQIPRGLMLRGNLLIT